MTDRKFCPSQGKNDRVLLEEKCLQTRVAISMKYRCPMSNSSIERISLSQDTGFFPLAFTAFATPFDASALFVCARILRELEREGGGYTLGELGDEFPKKK
jgi:hypothetical protein